MAAKVKESLDHLQVALVDGYVQRRLPPLVPGVQVGSAPLQHLDDGALIPERGVVHGPVPVLVLNNNARMSTRGAVSGSAATARERGGKCDHSEPPTPGPRCA